MIAYPPVTLTNYILLYNTTALSASFWNMTALFHTHLPRISEAGGMGYYFTLPNVSILATENGNSGQTLPFNVSLVPESQQGLIFGTFMFNNTPSFVTSTMSPLESALTALPNTTNNLSPIFAGGFLLPNPLPFSTSWSLGSTPQTVGSTHTRLGSYLLGHQGLIAHPLPHLAEAFATASAYGPYPQLGHLVAGPGVHRFALPATAPNHRPLPGGSNALNPAWRTAYTHLVLPAGWDTDPESKIAATAALHDRVDALRQLEPGSGAYMNEADPTNALWKEEFFGKENYEKLLEVKKKWDGEGVFWCRSCVGSDLWEIVEAEGVEGGQGVGQEVGGLCRK